MADIVSPAVRSRMMAGIQGRNTRPELLIRRALFARGFRFRVHRRDLPGKPDIVLPKHRAVILVNGCFWHGHRCVLFRWPTSNEDFWRTKIRRNRHVDRRVLQSLCNKWRILRIWECALKGASRLPIDTVIDDTISWLRSESESAEIRGRKRKRTRGA